MLNWRFNKEQPTAASILSCYTSNGAATSNGNWMSVCNIDAKVKKTNPIFHLSISGTTFAVHGAYPEVRVVRGNTVNNLNVVVSGPYEVNNTGGSKYYGDSGTGFCSVENIVNASLNQGSSQVFQLQLKGGGAKMGQGCAVHNCASLRVMELESS